jgi:predicted O-linked N-acetylglucosamine transferase (SPINDLY family)
MQLARAAYRSGQWRVAEQLLRALLQDSPTVLDAVNLLGIIAAQTQRLGEAADLFRRVIEFRDTDAAANNNYANALLGLGRFDEALARYDRALALSGADAEAHLNRGIVLGKLGRGIEAMASYERALEINGNLDRARYCRALGLIDLGRIDEAVLDLRRVLSSNPSFADAQYRCGNALHRLDRLAEARQHYREAIRLNPGFAIAHSDLGMLLHQCRAYGEALACFDNALAINPKLLEGLINRGHTRQELQQFEQALVSYDRALALREPLADVHASKGNALHRLGRLREATLSYERAMRLSPADGWHYGNWLHARMQACDWADFDQHLTKLGHFIVNRQRASQPFPLLSMLDSPALQRAAAEIWVQDNGIERQAREPPIFTSVCESGRIRIGYFSSDFHNHATAYLMAALFECHDRSRFETTAFSFGPTSQDSMRRRLESAFDRFVDVRGRPDWDIAGLAREVGLDIAVDLKGFTEGNRAGIFAHRAAPIQVSYLGYPGSTGSSSIDYVLADRFVIPEFSQRFFSEKVCYLPHSYYPSSYRMDAASGQLTDDEPRGADLPAGDFVFCCFNNSYKITPGTFNGWMRILTAVPGSVLWLLQPHDDAVSNLRRHAQVSDVDPNRLVFAPRLAARQHLLRHSRADLILDTFPYNAHTTATDALWAGVPVLTLPGVSFASRVAGSLLQTIGLPELICATQADYECSAIALAHDKARLELMRAHILQSRHTTALFDTQLLVRHLEAAYSAMHDRRCRGQKPDHIEVRPCQSIATAISPPSERPAAAPDRLLTRTNPAAHLRPGAGR